MLSADETIMDAIMDEYGASCVFGVEQYLLSKLLCMVARLWWPDYTSWESPL
jgi:hypothetical protein